MPTCPAPVLIDRHLISKGSGPITVSQGVQAFDSTTLERYPSTMDAVLTVSFAFLLVCTLPVFAGATWLAMERGEPIRVSAAGLSWFFRETAAHAVIIVLHVVGWWPVSPSHKRKQEDIADKADHAPRLPVLLVHGYSLNRACFTFLQTYLHTRGWEWIWAINHRPRSSPIPVFAKNLGRSIERLCDETGSDQIDIIGHSMGGIVTAYALKEFGYAHRVRRLITLGSPWAGSRTFVFSWLREGFDLAPQSEVISAIENYSGDTTAIWSRSDHLIVPVASAAPNHAECIEVPHLGHLEMMTSARCFRIVADALLAPGDEE
jgi:triacylglycerol lipase